MKNNSSWEAKGIRYRITYTKGTEVVGFGETSTYNLVSGDTKKFYYSERFDNGQIPDGVLVSIVYAYTAK